MISYCIHESSTEPGRFVTVITSDVEDGVETHSQGTVDVNDPDLPEWIRNSELPLDCYDEDGLRIER